MIGVTTFSAKGYELYGREFLESVEKYWPGRFVVYVDDQRDGSYRFSNGGGCTFRNLSDTEGHDQFVAYCKRHPVFQGMVDGHYHYTYDALKFCHKVFAQLDVLKNAQEPVFWIDADSVLLQPISEEFLWGLFDHEEKGGKFHLTLALLQRPGFYTESGFVGFSPHGRRFSEFLDCYTNVYRKGLLFTLQGWHDCYALDEAVRISEVPAKNLSPFYEHRKTTLDVIPESVLGPFIKHKKGNQKWTSTGTTNPTAGAG